MRYRPNAYSYLNAGMGGRDEEINVTLKEKQSSKTENNVSNKPA